MELLISSFLKLNLFDYLFLGLALLYIVEEVSFRLWVTVKHDIYIGLIYLSSLLGYSFISDPLRSQFLWSKGLADGISFLIIGGLTAGCVYLLSITMKDKISFSSPGSFWNRVFSIVLSTISFLVVSLSVVSLLVSFPVSNAVKEIIVSSPVGSNLLVLSQRMEANLKKTLGIYSNQTLNFQTVVLPDRVNKPVLGKVLQPVTDIKNEEYLSAGINSYREKRGIPTLVVDEVLSHIARDYAREMALQGYFSHYSVLGLSPFDRFSIRNYRYNTATESIVWAQDSRIALQGLLTNAQEEGAVLSLFTRIGVGSVNLGTNGLLSVILLVE